MWLLLNIFIENNDIMDDNVLLIDHYNEGRLQQISKNFVIIVQEIQDAIIEHLAFLEAFVKRPKQSSINKFQKAHTNILC